MKNNLIDLQAERVFRKLRTEIRTALQSTGRGREALISSVTAAAQRTMQRLPVVDPQCAVDLLWNKMSFREKVLWFAMRYVFRKTAAVLRFTQAIWGRAQIGLTDDFGEPIDALCLPPWLEPWPKTVCVVEYYILAPLPAESVVLTFTIPPEGTK